LTSLEIDLYNQASQLFLPQLGAGTPNVACIICRSYLTLISSQPFNHLKFTSCRKEDMMTYEEVYSTC